MPLYTVVTPLNPRGPRRVEPGDTVTLSAKEAHTLLDCGAIVPASTDAQAGAAQAAAEAAEAAAEAAKASADKAAAEAAAQAEAEKAAAEAAAKAQANSASTDAGAIAPEAGTPVALTPPVAKAVKATRPKGARK